MTREDCANCPYMRTEEICATETDNLLAWPSDKQPYCSKHAKWCEKVAYCCVGIANKEENKDV